jgi:capsular exopolysaccharide synthesis family protein
METQERPLDISKYVEAILRRRRFILLCGVLAALVTLPLVYFRQPTYQAEARVALVRAGTLVSFNPQIKTVSDAFDPTTSSDQTTRRRGLLGLAKDSDLAAAVIARLGDALPEKDRRVTPFSESVDITVDGDIIRVSARARSPQLAALVANTWAELYETRVNTVYGEAPVTLTDISQQAGDARRDFDTKEAALVKYLQTNPAATLQRQTGDMQAVVDSLRTGGGHGSSYLDSLIAARQAVLDQQAAAKIKRLTELYALQDKLDRLIGDASSLRARLTDPANSSGSGARLALLLLEASSFSTSASLSVTLQMPLDLGPGASSTEPLATVNGLLSTLTSRRQSIATEITALASDLTQNAGTETVSIQAQSLDRLLSYATYAATVDKAILQTETDINGLKARIEHEASTLRQLTQERDLAWSTYTALASKVAEVAIAERSTGSVAKLAASAIAPDDPMPSGRLSTVLLAAFLGVTLSACVVLVQAFADSSLRDSNRASAALSLPMLASLPRCADGCEPESAGGLRAAEPYGILRQRLLRITEPWKVLLITSAILGEGRTTVAANLALAFARAGKSVILVDADLRRPRLHTAMGLANQGGLAELMNGPVSAWASFAQDAGHARIRFISAGRPREDASLVLEAPAFGDLMALLRDGADLVIVDGPPALKEAGVFALLTHADLTILVVRGGRTPLADVQMALSTLAGAGAKLAGFVLNGATSADAPNEGQGRLGRVVQNIASRLGLKDEA